MNAHTKGPWMAAAAPSSIVGWPIVGSGGRAIAKITWVPRGPDVSDEDWAAFMAECEANARLIAASPDMLPALQGMQAFIAVMFGTGSNARIPETVKTPLGVEVKLGEIMRQVSAAISKTEKA